MKLKHFKYIFLSLFVLLILSGGIAAHFYKTSLEKSIQDFDAEKFRQTDHTEEGLYLFSDIAFNRPGYRIRKWHTDIKVEIKNMNDIPNEKAISEIDSAITIISGLIAPLKIERVETGGNLIIHTNTTHVPANRRATKPVFLNGVARINEATKLSWDITLAHIYLGRNMNTQTLMHELEHVLGLEHPFRLYDYYTTIARSVVPQDYTAYGTWLQFNKMPYYLSEPEKTAIRLLYSPEIKAGLQQSVFIEKLGVDW